MEFTMSLWCIYCSDAQCFKVLSFSVTDAWRMKKLMPLLPYFSKAWLSINRRLKMILGLNYWPGNQMIPVGFRWFLKEKGSLLWHIWANGLVFYCLKYSIILKEKHALNNMALKTFCLCLLQIMLKVYMECNIEHCTFDIIQKLVYLKIWISLSVKIVVDFLESTTWIGREV